MIHLKSHKNSTKRVQVYNDSAQFYIVNLKGDKCQQGFYLDKKKDNLSIIAHYSLEGIHHQKNDEDYHYIEKKMTQGLCQIPSDVTITVCHTVTQKPINPLKKGNQSSSHPTLALSYLDKMRNNNELTQQGKRLQRDLTLRIGFSLNQHHESFSWVDRALLKLQKVWQSWRNIEESQDKEDLVQLFLQTAQRLKDLENRIQEQMGLTLIPWNARQCAEALLQKKVNQVPHLITFDTLSGEISEISHQERDYASLQVSDEVPTALPDAIYHQGKWIGILVLEEKPSGWDSATDCLHYLWRIFKDTPEVTVVSQFYALDTHAYSRKLEFDEKISQGQMIAHNIVNTQAEAIHEDVQETRRQITKGCKVLSLAVVLVVRCQTRQELEETCRYLCYQVPSPACLTRERHYAWQIYQQTQPYSCELLLQKPLHRRIPVLSDNMTPFLALIKPHSPCSCGYELVSEGNTSIYMDIFALKHMAIFATTRSGKSVLIADCLQHVLMENIPVLLMDFPGPDGVSTFHLFTQALGGAYLNIREEAVNVLEIPSIDWLQDLEDTECRDWLDQVTQLLVAMVLGIETQAPSYVQQVETLIGLLLPRFLQDESIIKRYQKAFQGGFGSLEWKQMPTVLDFIEWMQSQDFEEDNLNFDELNTIASRLQYLAQGACRALAQPSTVSTTDNRLMAFALTNIRSDEEAFFYGLMFYQLILRKALKHRRQVIFIDEASILLKFDSLSLLFARLQANGAKFGIRLWIAAQDADTIYQSAGGAQIFANLSTILVGKIKPSAMKTLMQVQNYDRSLLLKNCQSDFGQNPSDLSSQWLLDDQEGSLCHCKAYIPPVLLAMVANNPSERTAREMFLSHYDNRLRGIAHFADILRYALAQGVCVDRLVSELIAEASSMPIPDFIEQWRCSR